MAAAKPEQKTAAKAVTKPKVNAAPKAAPKDAPKVAAKPAVKEAPKKTAPVSKTAKAIARINASIAKLTERKSNISDEINALKDQRTQLKAAPAEAVKEVKADPKAAKKKKKK